MEDVSPENDWRRESECAFCGEAIPNPNPQQGQGRVFCSLICFGLFSSKLGRNLRIAKLRTEGASVPQIAQRFGISPGRVRAILTSIEVISNAGILHDLGNMSRREIACAVKSRRRAVRSAAAVVSAGIDPCHECQEPGRKAENTSAELNWAI